MIVADGALILPEHLPATIREASGGAATQPDDGALCTLEAMERAHIERVLNAAGHHRAKAARMLGISERNLYRKLREYGFL